MSPKTAKAKKTSPASPPMKKVVYNRAMKDQWMMLKGKDEFKGLLVHFYLRYPIGHKDSWKKVQMHFENDVHLMLDMTALKTWFHNIGGLKEDSSSPLLKFKQANDTFNVQKAIDHLMNEYLNKPLSVAYYNKHKGDDDDGDDFISDDEKRTPKAKTNGGAPRTARMNPNSGSPAAAAAGAGAGAPSTPATPENRTLQRSASIEYTSDGGISPQSPQSPQLSRANSGRCDVYDVTAAVLQLSEVIATGLDTVCNRLKLLTSATHGIGKTNDIGFVAKEISDKKAAKKAAEQKERAAAMEPPAGPDGTVDIRGDEARSGRSQQNEEAGKVAATRQASISKDADAETKKRKQQQVDGAKFAATPEARASKRARKDTCTPPEAGAEVADSGAGSDGDSDAAPASAAASASSSSAAPSRRRGRRAAAAAAADD